ncbi:MAG: hypothetical protein IJ721_05890 [Bacteroidales bacterium]|nr:hypothetical protein [Bacteroidales bacterium]
MSLTVLYICIVAALPVAMLVLRDLPLVAGGILASGAGERRTVKVLLPVLMAGTLAGLALTPDATRAMLLDVLPSKDLQAFLAIGLSCIVSVLVTSPVSRHTSVQYAFIGAVAGLQLMVEGALDWNLAARYIGSWLLAPLVCGALAAGICRSATRRTGRGVHLAVVDRRLLAASTGASLLLVAAFSWNNALLVDLFPVVIFSDGPLAAGVAVVLTGLVCLLSLRGITAETWRIADRELDIPSVSVFSILLATALTLCLFSSGLVRALGLAPTPLATSGLILSALVGTSLARGRAAVEGEPLLKSAVATALAPLLSILLSYSLGIILNVTPEDEGPAGWTENLTSTWIVLGIVLCAAAVVTYLRYQRRRSLQEQIMRSREQQIYSSRKSLSALEVKAEMNEKDLLNKLEMKRKELVDFAVGISEQKEFMEAVYERLSEIRRLDDPAERDRKMDALLASLRERMYFTREMNDFYAQSEILHKDFNMRLRETFPNLTDSERKLANLLRQGFSSKYIASLMNITPKSVEIGRYRLRSKLGLKRNDNLVRFIKSI